VLSIPGALPWSTNILDLIAGIVFFGTPHTKKNRPESWAQLTKLLKYTGNFAKRFLVQSELDALAAASLSEDFEQSGIEAPVLSIYETKSTRVKEGFWPFRQEVIVCQPCPTYIPATDMY